MSEQKKRHGCLTAWLVLMLVANSEAVLIYTLGSAGVRQNYPNAPDWAFPVLEVIGIANVVCVVALFKWKKWGSLAPLRRLSSHSSLT